MLIGGSAIAAADGIATAASASDDQIVVTGTRDAASTRTATRTDTKLKDVPQAITVVPRQQIDDAALRSIGDVLRTVPGALIGQGEGHRDQVTLRGNASTADFFVDGLRDDVQYYRGLYNVDRVEVLKGPNAMIFGRGGGGGVVNRVVDRGVPSAGGRPLLGFRDAFFGARGVNDSDFDAHVVRADVEHRFSDSVGFNGKLLYGRYDKTYQNAFAATAVTTNSTGVPQVGIEAYRDATDRENLFIQNDLVARVATGGIGHVLLAGIEYGDQGTDNERVNGFFDGPVTTTSARRRTIVALAERLAIPAISFRAGPGNRRVRSDADLFAAYAQDQLSLGDHVEIVAGLRYDRFRLTVAEPLSGARFDRTDDLWSPRAGLVLKPVEPLSLYASYSRSYLPQSGDQFLSLDASLETLEPERFDNIEVGAKWEPVSGLLLTAAAYRLDRVNSRAPGAVAGTTELTGEQRSQGIELAASGRMTAAWTLSAGYALQDAEIRQATSAGPAGRDVPLVPRHQASLWTRYDVGP